VARRLLMAFGAVIVAFAVTVGYGVMAQRRAARDNGLLRTGYVPLLLSLGATLENQNLVSAQLNHITEAKNPADAQRWIETARRVRPTLYSEIRAAAQQAGAASTDAHARLVAGQIAIDSGEVEQFLSHDGPQLASLFDALASDRTDRAEQYRANLLSQEIEGARRMRELKARVEREMDGLMAEARQRETRGIESLIALASLTLIVGLGMTLHAHRVLRPLASVTARANAVARGDLTPHPVMATPDEIGELATTFEGMVAAIAKANHDRLQSERLAVVGRMAAHVTHEIRNPLSSIGLNLELLEEDLASSDSKAESRQLVTTIRREVDHLSGISQEYLSLARPPQPRLEPEKLGDIVSEFTAFVAPELDRAGVTLQLELLEAPEAMVDEAHIRQALANLVRNAREAMPKGGIVRIRVRADGPRHVRMDVEDTGPGIPEQIRQSIFDPFFTTKNRGTGLGLAVTRQIIEANHGTITCEPGETIGTRFEIRVPTAEVSTS
jgi:two-component system, NtrC family, sensor kinase